MINHLSAQIAIDRTLSDLSTSYWLKKAIWELKERDALDAAIDAEHLAELFMALVTEPSGSATNPRRRND
jgi:hypothetical protein